MRVLVGTGLLSIVTGVLFGLAPAIQTSNVDLATTLKESGRDGMAAGGAQRFRSALVTVQIGLALMLLIGAALMGNSLLKLLNNPLGADPKNLLTFEFRFSQDELMRPVDKYRGVGLWEIFPVTGLTFDRVWERIQTIPGVRSAAAISRAPLSGNAMGMQFFIAGQAAARVRTWTKRRVLRHHASLLRDDEDSDPSWPGLQPQRYHVSSARDDRQ